MTPGLLLNGTEPVWLWISWANSALTAGSGNVVGSNRFLSYADMTPVAQATTVAVSAFATDTVEFTIPYDQDQSTTGLFSSSFNRHSYN